MLLNDDDITQLAMATGMICPFEPSLVRKLDGVPAVSFGLGSFAYDMRLGRRFTWPTRGRLDPKRPSLAVWEDITTDDAFWIQPGQMVLAESLEAWSIPADVYVMVLGKSTYARNGLIVNVTPMEPGWRGILTIEISNTSTLPACVYPGEGIAAAVFLRGQPPLVTYADRSGKYQDQEGVERSKV